MLPPANVSQGLSAAVAVIGIVGAVFYFMNNKLFVTFIFIWSLAQLLIIENKTTDPETGYKITRSILDLDQGIKISFGLTSGAGNNSLYVGINFLSIIFLGLAKVLSLSVLYGAEITITSFGENSTYDDVLPAMGTIERRVTLAKEKRWLLARLQPKTEGESSFQYALIKPKDNSRLKLNKKQVVHFILVPDINMLKEGNNLPDDFIGRWAVVE
jgi:hypothetical protein